jgi:hypothetical protein
MYQQFDFNIRVTGSKLFVYPLEENELIYLAQTTGKSKFNLGFEWFEVSENWVLQAHTHGFRFCRSF